MILLRNLYEIGEEVYSGIIEAHFIIEAPAIRQDTWSKSSFNFLESQSSNCTKFV